MDTSPPIPSIPPISSAPALAVQPRMSSLAMPTSADPMQTQQINEAKKTQMLASLANMGVQNKGVIAPQAVSTLAAGQLSDQAKVQHEAMKQQTANLVNSGQVNLSAQKQLASTAVSNTQISLNDMQQEFANKLNRISTGLKSQLVDSEMQIKKDAAGRELLSTRQLIDWSVLNAKNQQDYLAHVQQIDQAGQRKIAILKMADAKIKQAIDQGYIRGKQIQDEALKKELDQLKQQTELSIMNEQAAAANRMAIATAAVGLLGMGVGALGGVGGAALGGAIGSAVGAGIGSGKLG